MDYHLALDLEAIRFLLSLKSSNRVNLLQKLEQLKNSPFLAGQFTVKDSTDREIQVSAISIQVVKIEINS